MRSTSIMLTIWRFSILLIPIMIVVYFALPHTWLGNVGMAIAFSLMAAVIFIFMPKLVGEKYTNEAYTKILSFVKTKLHISK